MKIQPAVKKETGHIACWSGAGTILMIVAFAICHKLFPEAGFLVKSKANFTIFSKERTFESFRCVKAFGKMGYTTKLVAQLMRDLGSIPAPMNSFPSESHPE